MKSFKTSLVLATLAATMQMSVASAQTAGPEVAVQAITQVTANMPQYTAVDQPLLRDGMAKATNDRVQVFRKDGTFIKEGFVGMIVIASSASVAKYVINAVFGAHLPLLPDMTYL